MAHMHEDKFRAEVSRPAHDRMGEVEAEIVAAKRELEALIRAPEFDETAAEAVQLRLESLERARVRWTRRHTVAQAFLTARSATGFVELTEAL